MPSVGEKIFPQNARNARNLLAEKSLPQMSTDVHRCRRVWHPCHTHAAKFCEFCGRTAHSKHLCKSVPSVGEKIFPQNARNTRNLLAEKSLPQMSTDVHRLGGYGIPAIPTLPNSVYSVNSVGEQRTITICVNPCHLWEKRYSRRTHARNLLAEKSLPQMSTDVHRLGGGRVKTPNINN